MIGRPSGAWFLCCYKICTLFGEPDGAEKQSGPVSLNPSCTFAAHKKNVHDSCCYVHTGSRFVSHPGRLNRSKRTFSHSLFDRQRDWGARRRHAPDVHWRAGRKLPAGFSLRPNTGPVSHPVLNIPGWFLLCTIQIPAVRTAPGGVYHVIRHPGGYSLSITPFSVCKSRMNCLLSMTEQFITRGQSV